MKKRKIPEPGTYLSMADPSHHPKQQQLLSTGGPHQVSGRSWLYASVAGLATGGLLLCMSGFSFLASLTLLLITAPLLLIFSPLIFGAALVLAGATASFGVATMAGLAGIVMIVWMVRSVFRGREDGIGEKVQENGQEWAGYLQQKVQENVPIENSVETG
ncbi:unnamed protein product [Dovyalis caffra]|uniref:Oleosin n=1 Tax=Dovyalis caffra TaxID=77055 RepID=A0AAV1QUY8_9ROSI|nr:unnamed protein product [Dovyalis caffra]